MEGTLSLREEFVDKLKYLNVFIKCFNLCGGDKLVLLTYFCVVVI